MKKSILTMAVKGFNYQGLATEKSSSTYTFSVIVNDTKANVIKELDRNEEEFLKTFIGISKYFDEYCQDEFDVKEIDYTYQVFEYAEIELNDIKETAGKFLKDSNEKIMDFNYLELDKDGNVVDCQIGEIMNKAVAKITFRSGIELPYGFGGWDKEMWAYVDKNTLDNINNWISQQIETGNAHYDLDTEENLVCVTDYNTMLDFMEEGQTHQNEEITNLEWDIIGDREINEFIIEMLDEDNKILKSDIIHIQTKIENLQEEIAEIERLL